jgi:hypothetical protein
MIRTVPMSVLILTLLAVVGCGPRETPEQRLATLRAAHDIVPTAWANTTDADGNPRLVVDLRVTNQAADPLEKLTVLVTVDGPDGSEKLRRQVTLDLAGLRPGLDTQTAALVPGFKAGEFDRVEAGIEGGLSDEELRALPEFSLIEP